MEFQLALKDIVQKYGKDIFLDVKRLKALLADYQVEKKYITQVETFLKTGHLKQIIESAPTQIDTLKQNKLVDSICEDTGYDHKNVTNTLTHILTTIGIENKKVIVKKEEVSDGIVIQVNKQLGIIRAYDSRTSNTLTIAKVQIMASTGDVVAQCAMGDYFSNPETVDFGKAMIWYKKAAESGYAKAQWLYGTGFFNGLGVQKDLIQAEYWFRKSAEQGYADGQYGLAGYYVTNKDYVNAEIWLKKAVLQGHADAKIMLETISSFASHYAVSKSGEANKNLGNHVSYDDLLKKAFSEYKTGGWDKAISYLDSCIDNNRNFLGAYIVRGEIYLQMDDYQKALSDFRKAIEIDPNNVTAFYDRGLLYVKLGEVDKSLADFDKAIYLDVTYADAYANRANVFLQMREFEKAVRDCTKAIELSPDDSFIALYNRGLAYANLKKFPKALADFSDAIQQAPENGTTQIAEVFAKRGMCHIQLGNRQDALRDFEKFLELDPQNPNASLIRDGLKELRRM